MRRDKLLMRSGEGLFSLLLAALLACALVPVQAFAEASSSSESSELENGEGSIEIDDEEIFVSSEAVDDTPTVGSDEVSDLESAHGASLIEEPFNGDPTSPFVSTDGVVREAAEGTIVPDFEFEDLAGAVHSFEKDFGGKPRIVVLGRAACENTAKAAKSLEKILSKRGREGARGLVLAFEPSDDEAFSEKYADVETKNVLYAVSNGVAVRELFWEAYGKAGFDGRSVSELPFLFFVDGGGVIRLVATGELPDENLANAVDRLIEMDASDGSGEEEEAAVPDPNEKGDDPEAEAPEDQDSAEGEGETDGREPSDPAINGDANISPEVAAPEDEKPESGKSVDEEEDSEGKDDTGVEADKGKEASDEESSADTLGATIAVGNFKYELNDDNKSVTLYSYVNEPWGKVTIPSSVKIGGRSYPVTRLENGRWYSVFAQCDNITEVVIPSSVKYIGKSAFFGCDKLAKVTLPSGSLELGSGCFASCPSLTSIHIPKGLRLSRSDSAPFAYSGLANVTFWKGITTIPDGLLSGCRNLKGIAIPNTVKTIGSYAFSQSGLARVAIPASVKTISGNAFEECKSLASISIPSSVTSIKQYAFYNCTSLTSVSIPNSVQTVEIGAFRGCSKLAKVTIASGLKSIAHTMFYDCSSLNSINLPESIAKIETGAFGGCPLRKLYIPPATTSIDKGYWTTIPSDTVIQGYSGTYAEVYAKNNNMFFESLGKIKPNLSGASIAKIANQSYTGKAIAPVVKVVYKGKTLKKNVDYTVSYSNNKSIGTATVTVKGKGAYQGSKKATFAIVAAVERLAGSIALDTMASVTKQGFKSGSCRTVVVATTDGYWDALTASSLAGLNKCPILLTEKSSLSPQAASEIKRLGSSTVYIAGGTAAVSSSVEKSISRVSGVKTVKRLAGSTAINTALKIYQQGKGSWGKTAVVATSGGFHDALSVSPYAYAKKAPIFLANASTHKLDSQVLSAIKKGGFNRVVIVGGTAAVSTQVEKQLKGMTCKRLAGATAYETSAAIASWCVSQGMKANNVGVATGTGYYDALAGAALCGKNNAALVLADDANRSAIKSFVAPRKKSITRAYVFGGTAAVSAGTYNAVTAALKR